MTERRLTTVLSRIEEDDNGCWLWQGNRSTAGYARLSHRDFTEQELHRAMYRHFVGPLLEGMVVHHNCEVRHCINPEHLVQVTIKEHRNLHPLRNRPLCNRGHALVGSNRESNGRAIRCRICANERARRYYHKRRNTGVQPAKGMGRF